MKHIISTGLAAAVLFGGVACSEKEVTLGAGEGAVSFRLEMNGTSGTRAEAQTYDPKENLMIRIYNAQGLVRRYKGPDAMPQNLYLVAGDYRVVAEAGSKAAATWDEMSFRGEKTFTVVANQTIKETVKCPSINIGVRVRFDASMDKFNTKQPYVNVFASDAYPETNQASVPMLRYDHVTGDKVGYFILPEGVENISWGFFGEGDEPGNVEQKGVISIPKAAQCYTLNFRFSKTPGGHANITVRVDTSVDTFDDEFIFSAQPTVSGEGFELDKTVGYTTGQTVSLNVASLEGVATVALGGETIYDASARAGAPAGVTCTPDGAGNVKVSLGPEYLGKFSTGYHDLTITVTDVKDAVTESNLRIAMPGLLPLREQDYDPWLNTATFRAIVTEADPGNVVFSYRKGASGSWSTANGVKGEEFLYTATAEPTWVAGTNTSHTTWKIDNTTGFFAGGSYTYKLQVGSATEEEAATPFVTPAGPTIPYGEINDGSLSCFTENNGSSQNWASGNNSFAKSLCTLGSFAGMEGSGCAKLAAAKAAGVLAAGNIFTGIFYKANLTTGVVEFGQPYEWEARPRALRVKYYAEQIGTVNVNMHAGAPIGEGAQDRARIFVAIVDWNVRHKVSSGTKAPTGVWDPMGGADVVSEGKVIAYGSLFIDKNSEGGSMIDVELPLEFYDKTAKPAGTYSLVISCATSAYGDYMVGCSTNVLYVDDFRWVF